MLLSVIRFQILEESFLKTNYPRSSYRYNLYILIGSVSLFMLEKENFLRSIFSPSDYRFFSYGFEKFSSDPRITHALLDISIKIRRRIMDVGNPEYPGLMIMRIYIRMKYKFIPIINYLHHTLCSNLNSDWNYLSESSAYCVLFWAHLTERTYLSEYHTSYVMFSLQLSD